MNTVNSSIDRAIEQINTIVKENPAVTHINIRRADEMLVDIPVAQAEMTIRRHPNWRVEDGAYPKIELNVISGNYKKNTELPVIALETVVLPPKPSEKLDILPPQPPVDNAHVALGAGKFDDKTVAANKAPTASQERRVAASTKPKKK